jgi:hypothetical protein
MGWIAFADSTLPAVEPRLRIEELKRGSVFSLNTQARKFELKSIEIQASAGYPEGRIEARTVKQDGSYGPDAILNYGQHRAAKVVVWADLVADEEVTRPLSMFEKVQSMEGDMQGVIIELNKSKFPDCDIIVVWEKPYKGELITEMHAPELKGTGECLGGEDKWGEKTLNEIRAMVMELQEKHEQKYEDKTREIIQEQLASHQASIKALDGVREKEVDRVVGMLAEQQALFLKSVKDSCVMHVSAGIHNYEADRMGEMLTNYLDDLYRMASRLTPDPLIANRAASVCSQVIADAALRDYFLTRFAYVREGDKGRWNVYSEQGKLLGHYASKDKAVRTLRQAEGNLRRSGSFRPEEIESLDQVTG